MPSTGAVCTGKKIEMSHEVTRRDFLKMGAAAAGALALGQFVPPRVAKAARQLDVIDANGERVQR